MTAINPRNTILKLLSIEHCLSDAVHVSIVYQSIKCVFTIIVMSTLAGIKLLLFKVRFF